MNERAWRRTKSTSRNVATSTSWMIYNDLLVRFCLKFSQFVCNEVTKRRADFHLQITPVCCLIRTKIGNIPRDRSYLAEFQLLDTTPIPAIFHRFQVESIDQAGSGLKRDPTGQWEIFLELISWIPGLSARNWIPFIWRFRKSIF